MDIGFGDALLIVGLLLAVSAALSGGMHGTVLSISVLSVSLGIILALAGVVSVDIDDRAIVELIELALVLTLFSDGLAVERELLTVHWSPPVRALALAMPLTLALLALCAHLVFPEMSWSEALLLAAVLSPTDPVVTSTVVTSQRVPALIRHTLNLDAGRECWPRGRQAARRGGGRRGDRPRARDRRGMASSPAPGRGNHAPVRGDIRDRDRPRRLRACRCH